MELVALGTCGVYPGPGRACAGWLVESGATRLLLDCGHGVLANLQTRLPLHDLTAILITHLHADHFLDLIPFRYAIKYGPPGPRPHPTLYLPQDGLDALMQSVAVLDPDPDFFTACFDVRHYTPDVPLTVGGLRVALAPTVHPVPTCAVAVSEPGGGRAVYSSDTGPSPVVEELARGADLFICEATLSSPEDEAGRPRVHLAPEEAAEMATRAGVGRLVLTHVPPYRDPATALPAAQQRFSGPVLAARDGETFRI
ncbi:MAG: MBL fold metallo-hydrolase [Chloroflexi bacterium]|nr:MBL fold metallo-hydrolase [Chloroflexota bacterium]